MLLSDDLRASLADGGVAQLLARHCGGGAATTSPGGSPGSGGEVGGGPPASLPPLAAGGGPEGVAQMYAAPEQLAGQRCSLAADMYRWGGAEL